MWNWISNFVKKFEAHADHVKSIFNSCAVNDRRGFSKTASNKIVLNLFMVWDLWVSPAPCLCFSGIHFLNAHSFDYSVKNELFPVLSCGEGMKSHLIPLHSTTILVSLGNSSLTVGFVCVEERCIPSLQDCTIHSAKPLSLSPLWSLFSYVMILFQHIGVCSHTE